MSVQRAPVPESVSIFPNLKNETYLYGAHTAEVSRGWICNRHLHHLMFEINLVIEGCQTCTIGEEVIEQHPGDLVIIPPMQLHEFKLAQSDVMRYFVFHAQISDADLMRRMAISRLNYVPVGHPLNERIRPHVVELMNQLRSNSSKSAIFHRLFAFLNELELYYVNESPLDASTRTSDSLADQIAREIEHLVIATAEEEDRAPLTNWLETLSQKIGISKRHSARVFQETYRISPRDYLAILRRQEAMHALLNGSESLEHISRRIGFENVQSFIRQFMKWTGTTPGAYRKSHRDDFYYLTPLEER